MTAPLFGVDPPPAAPVELTVELTSDRRRTARQADALTRGAHPLGLALRVRLPLHPDAAPADDRAAPGRRCGDCRHRQAVRWHGRAYAKCLAGDGWPRASHGAGTDVRAWWPACVDHAPDQRE